MSIEQVDITSKGTKEAYELGLALKSYMKNYKVAVADGFQVGQDIPAVLLGSIQETMKGLDNLIKLGEEGKEKPFAMTRSFLIPVTEGLEILFDK